MFRIFCDDKEKGRSHERPFSYLIVLILYILSIHVK